MDEKFVRNLLPKIKCGRCGQQCEPANIDVMGHQEDLWLFSAYCSSCKSQGLVLVAVAIKESEEPGVVTEPTEAEQTKFSTPISSDDVLDMHTFLKDFSGDFSSL